jgi:hypothetical protein
MKLTSKLFWMNNEPGKTHGLMLSIAPRKFGGERRTKNILSLRCLQKATNQLF